MKKFFVYSFGGLVALIVMTMAVVAVTGSNQQVEKLTLITDLAWGRLAGYALLVATWWLFSPKLIQQRDQVLPETEQQAQRKDLAEAGQVLRDAWWKLALFFVAFEIIIVRQFGAAS